MNRAPVTIFHDNFTLSSTSRFAELARQSRVSVPSLHCYALETGTVIAIEHHPTEARRSSTLKRFFNNARVIQQPLNNVREHLSAYFAGIHKPFSLPCKLYGTAFQQAVWNVIQDIPYGSVQTYGEIAREVAGNLDMTGNVALLARAVGSGVGMNPLSIVIPCHRVLNTAAPHKPYTVGKYGGSEAVKRILLRLELSDKNGNLRKGVPQIIL